MFHKYHAKRTEIDGIKFASKAEAAYYSYLKLAKIKIIDLQPKIYLTDARILYKPDFLIEENGIKKYIEVKGMRTAVFNIKLRLFKKYCEMPLIIVSYNGRKFKIEETVNI